MSTTVTLEKGGYDHANVTLTTDAAGYDCASHFDYNRNSKPALYIVGSQDNLELEVKSPGGTWLAYKVKSGDVFDFVEPWGVKLLSANTSGFANPTEIRLRWTRNV